MVRSRGLVLAGSAGGAMGVDAASAGTVVMLAVRGLVVGLNAADPAVRGARAIQGSDAVHDMRRITRQLRSLLATYRRLFAHDSVAQLRTELQWLGRMLGVARDVEVRRSRAARELQLIPYDDASAWARLVDADRREYAGTLVKLRQVLDGKRYARLLADLDGFVAQPPLRKRAHRPASTVLLAAIRKQIAVVHVTADAAQASDSDREAALHEARKALRRLRYSISVLEGGAGGAGAGGAGGIGRGTRGTRGTGKKHDRAWRPGKKLRAVAATAKPVVSSLGAHRDRLLFAEHVMIVARQARTDRNDTFVYGLIIGRLAERTRSGHDTLLVELHAAVRRIVTLARDL